MRIELIIDGLQMSTALYIMKAEKVMYMSLEQKQDIDLY